MNGEAPTVGLIGVGLLGSALAERLLHAGFAVVGFDINPERCSALKQLGGYVTVSEQEVVHRCDCVLLSLPNTASAAGVLTALEPELRSGLLLIDTTTTEPSWSEQTGARLHERGIEFIDATVVGSSEQARQGDVITLTGGLPASIQRADPLLAAFARQRFHVGPWGSGARMKLVVNLVLGLNRAVLAEGLNFACTCGLDPGAALAVLKAGAAYSRVMDSKGDKMLQHDFTPQARLAQHLKDVRLILAEGEKNGASLPLSQLHRDLLERLDAAGFGGEDNSAILRAFEG